MSGIREAIVPPPLGVLHPPASSVAAPKYVGVVLGRPDSWPGVRHEIEERDWIIADF
jgi:hypothetical protein